MTDAQIVDAHHHIWRMQRTPWLAGPPAPRIFGPYDAIRRDYLIEVVSNRQAEVDIRTVDALVARLRRKLVGSGTPVIATVTGVGYKLALSERL